MDDPHVFEGWQTGFGDISFGVKANLAAPWRQNPAAFAVRGGVKLPTSADDDGAWAPESSTPLSTPSSAAKRHATSRSRRTAAFTIAAAPTITT